MAVFVAPDEGNVCTPVSVAREVRLRPAGPDRVRFAIRIELDDAAQPVTTLAIETEVKPTVVRDHGSTELIAGFGPENLLAVTPELGADSERALGDAAARWLPPVVRDRLPRGVLDRAARELATHLTGAAYKLLQTTLLRRLGEITQLRLQLPDLPIASVALRSSAARSEALNEAHSEALTVDVTTDLPVRRGLTAATPAGDEVPRTSSSPSETAGSRRARCVPRWWMTSYSSRCGSRATPRRSASVRCEESTERLAIDRRHQHA